MAPGRKDIDVEAVKVIAKEAGDAIMVELGKLSALGSKEAIDEAVLHKGDDSPVTQADKKANEIIKKGLKTLTTPPITILSEEDTEEERLAALKKATYWTVDPLDGTRTAIDYAKGHKDYDGFGVHIALIESGVPTLGVVYFPANDSYYFTGNDGKAYQEIDGKQTRLQPHTDASPAQLAVALPYKESQRPLTIAGKIPSVVPIVGGGRIISVAKGEGDHKRVDAAYLNKGFNFWDVAAAHAVLRAAGGELVTVTPGAHADLQKGELLRYNRNYGIAGKIPPCVAAHSKLLAGLGAQAITEHRREEVNHSLNVIADQIFPVDDQKLKDRFIEHILGDEPMPDWEAFKPFLKSGLKPMDLDIIRDVVQASNIAVGRQQAVDGAVKDKVYKDIPLPTDPIAIRYRSTNYRPYELHIDLVLPLRAMMDVAEGKELTYERAFTELDESVVKLPRYKRVEGFAVG
ncbi:MAG: inositol monophosphatase family protein [Rickettsiales bacterium]|nr:inositol monophosphatase family protein [Rickettsiales bacterium]